MCNDFGNRVPYDDYLQAFSRIRGPVVFPVAAPESGAARRYLADRSRTGDSPPRRGRRFAAAWGFPAARPKGAPVINFRSEAAAS